MAATRRPTESRTKASNCRPLRRRSRSDRGAAPRHRAVLDTAARAAGWPSPAPSGRTRGIAIHETEQSIVATVAEVSLTDDGFRVHQLTSAIDCGLIVNPAIVEAQVEGAAIDGLTSATLNEVTLSDGQVEQSNFHDYGFLRINVIPRVKVELIASAEPPTGAGEAGLPPIAPAVANALAPALGRRIRRLPLRIAPTEA